MDLGIAGKVAMVVGGSQGIGKEIALALAHEGTHLVVCARTKETLLNAAKEIESETKAEVLPIVADVTKETDVEQLVNEAISRFGQIDILINVANNSRSAGFFELTDQDWFNHVDVKLMGKVRVIRAVAPYMMEHHWGRIINLGGGASRRVRQADGTVGSWTSGPINAGITNLSKRLCDELGPYGITVNTVLPGGVDTPGTARRRERSIAEHQDSSDVSAVSDRTTRRPIGRAITAADSANLICFIVSELAGAFTGQIVSIDGGATPAVYY